MSDQGSAIVLVGISAGALTAFVSGLPHVGLCVNVLLILLAGGAVVRVHIRDRSGAVERTTGAGLGAAAAGIAALVNGAIGAILSGIGARPGWDEAVQEGIRRMREMGSPEQQIETMRRMLESSWFFAAVMGCGLLVYAFFGMIGGVIGASIFGREEESDR